MEFTGRVVGCGGINDDEELLQLRKGVIPAMGVGGYI
jgi:hypothetical protein